LSFRKMGNVSSFPRKKEKAHRQRVLAMGFCTGISKFSGQ
jgi:hypothetical protein